MKIRKELSTMLYKNLTGLLGHTVKTVFCMKKEIKHKQKFFLVRFFFIQNFSVPG